jgi:formate dehydrogenase maturation protein FdhE
VKRVSLSKTSKVVGLFIAAAVSVYACSSSEEVYNDDCVDENNDGYCDDDGSPAGSSFIDIDGKKKFKRLSSGKSGIGSSATSSSG